MQSSPGLIQLFTRHPVAANLLMVIMLIAGFWALQKLNKQFFPSSQIDDASIRVVWSGASAEDVESLITTKIEQSLRNVDFVNEMTSTSAEGVSRISIEFEEGTDMNFAMDQVQQQVDSITTLPTDAEEPEVQKDARYESVSRMLIVAQTEDINELRYWVRRFETELLNRGISKVDVVGLPEEEIVIEVDNQKLNALGLSIEDLGRLIRANSRDAPMGVLGRETSSRQLRFDNRGESTIDFENLSISLPSGQRVLLGQIASIELRNKPGQTLYYHEGKPAVSFTLRRTESADSLRSAEIFSDWLADAEAVVPEGVEIIAYAERWQLLKGRIDLLIKNGLGGLILVVLILFLFLNGRVAFWVAMGIPISFMGALSALYAFGGTIDMLSLFGLIMALGIIVDDAIVVGEETMARFSHGPARHLAAEQAAQRMIAPVFSSSLTTIAAFMPLLIVGGRIGDIMQAIPLVVICVIIASLIECFLILPGHLHHSLSRIKHQQKSPLRERLDGGFRKFRAGFRRVLIRTLKYPERTVVVALILLLITVGWAQSGRIAFTFFPTAEADRLYLNVTFVSGTPASKVREFLDVAEQELKALDARQSESFIDLLVRSEGSFQFGSGSGEHLGSLLVELVDPDRRQIRNRDIIKSWRESLPLVAGLENLAVVEPRAGPPGSDVDVRIVGSDVRSLKQAAVDLQSVLRGIGGVSGIGDDAPYGREQLVLSLTPTAKNLGLSVDAVSAQIRAAFDGFDVQTLSDGNDDVEVVARLKGIDRWGISELENLAVVLADGSQERLGNLVTLDSFRGFDSIRHSDGVLAVSVTASVDPDVANANDIRAQLERDVLPALSSKYGAVFEFAGRQADQRKTLGDMGFGAIIALVLVYLVLAWVFGSYGWPILVMIIIPFAMIGSVFGHELMGKDMTLLSLFGLFGLSGIVVNDSIILVVFYKQLKARGYSVFKAVVEAACQRLRAVLLTSLTTIAGLIPLLFETSLQAQFLIPMAISMAFGLAFATLLIMFLLPALLLIYEYAALRLRHKVAAEVIDAETTT